VDEFAAAYERRLKSSYVNRIFAQDDFSFVRPVVDQVARTYAAWQASLSPANLPDSQTAPLRAELIAVGSRLDVAVRQARLLAEAALVRVPGSFDSTGLAAKPKRRSGRGLPFGFEETAMEPSSEEAREDSEISDLESSALPESDASQEPAPPPASSPAEAPPSPEAAAETAPAEAAAETTPAEAKPARRGRKKAESKPPPETA
jgi:hypothetical protein